MVVIVGVEREAVHGAGMRLREGEYKTNAYFNRACSPEIARCLTVNK